MQKDIKTERQFKSGSVTVTLSRVDTGYAYAKRIYTLDGKRIITKHIYGGQAVELEGMEKDIWSFYMGEWPGTTCEFYQCLEDWHIQVLVDKLLEIKNRYERCKRVGIPWVGKQP
jgi:hypothetical protein